MNTGSGITQDDGGRITFSSPCGITILGPPEADTFRAIRQHRQECPACSNTELRNLGA